MINKNLRLRILEQGLKLKHGHYGSSMSCVDAIKFLYDEVLTIDDTFIMSKGHGAPALHAVLESQGKCAPWTIHLECNPSAGISTTSGSLGHGLCIAVGRAYGKKVKGKGRVFCLIGDGELQEGNIWEALNIAKRFQLDNLILLVDWNKYQALSSIESVMQETKDTIWNKLTSFGCTCILINGHSNDKLKSIKTLPSGKLHAVILDTIKGYGIPFLEENPSYHVIYMHERPDVYTEALENLK